MVDGDPHLTAAISPGALTNAMTGSANSTLRDTVVDEM
jgi:hypothetical protein